MLITDREMDFLRLAGWCKSLSPALAGKIAGAQVQKALERDGFISAGKTVRLKPAGYRLLKSVGWDYPQDTKYRSDETTVKNRIDAAQIVYLHYRAGINVFADSLPDLRHAPTYLPSFAVRRNKSLAGNVFHGSRFSGILRTLDTAYLVLNISNAAGKMYYSSELHLFHNVVAPLNLKHFAILCAADSYQGAYERLAIEPENAAKPVRKNDAVSYADMYRVSQLPVHIISLDDTGAKQLMIMAQEKYRARIAEAAAGTVQNAPSYCDALLNSQPLVVAVDMDIKRIDKAIDAARKDGYEKIAIVALHEQFSKFLNRRYKGRAELYEITNGIVHCAFPSLGTLRSPSKTPFITAEGRYVDVSDFYENSKTGG